MNIISLKNLNLPYYGCCAKDQLMFEVPTDSPEIKIRPHYIRYVICPECKQECQLTRCREEEPRYGFGPSVEMITFIRSFLAEKRITQLEYAPPPNGGNKFQEILNEAKEAGDFKVDPDD